MPEASAHQPTQCQQASRLRTKSKQADKKSSKRGRLGHRNCNHQGFVGPGSRSWAAPGSAAQLQRLSCQQRQERQATGRSRPSSSTATMSSATASSSPSASAPAAGRQGGILAEVPRGTWKRRPRSRARRPRPRARRGRLRAHVHQLALALGQVLLRRPLRLLRLPQLRGRLGLPQLRRLGPLCRPLRLLRLLQRCRRCRLCRLCRRLRLLPLPQLLQPRQLLLLRHVAPVDSASLAPRIVGRSAGTGRARHRLDPSSDCDQLVSGRQPRNSCLDASSGRVEGVEDPGLGLPNARRRCRESPGVDQLDSRATTRRRRATSASRSCRG